ncbi:amidohydrolase [candidate division TA06 bacterium]|uniref:Amidohydrolase n=1 Tax=candidate division TA06 bacterium TaxID=2250710 RepID=A0A933IAP6_UNCT6|nr:amidohydrolase [candidate division TA06 bacterium]
MKKVVKTGVVRLFINARIHTLADKSTAEALAYDAFTGTILSVGTQKELLAGYKSLKPEIIDLQGMTVLPGFTDCHTHFCGYSLMLTRPNLDGLRSLKDCLAETANYLKNKKPGQWLLGAGWNKNLWTEGRLPHKSDLDAIAPHNPVFLWSKDWHTAWLNSAAIRELELSSGMNGLPGSLVEKDKDGRPSGIVREEAANQCYSRIPKPSEKEQREALRLGQLAFAKLGLTGFHTMETGLEFSLLQRLNRDGLLLLRAVAYLREDSLSEAVGLELRSGFGDDFLKFGGLKLFIDGSLGSQTALMLKAYSSGRSCGLQVADYDQLLSLVKTSARHGMACAIHAIGDAANKMALDIYQKTRNLDKSLRQRIEHCQLVETSDISRFKELGIIASVQPVHLVSDIDLIKKHWAGREASAYPFGSLVRNGATVVFGSDAPVETPNPFKAIQAAVTRQKENDPGTAFYPEERINIRRAVRAYTVDAAYAGGREKILGALKPGKLADFICLSDDIFQTPAEAISQLKVERTFVGGKEI